MAIFESFPYTDFHQLNLDWLIKKLKEYIIKTDAVEIKVDDFIENLDINDAVDQKLQEWADSGYLQQLIADYLSTETLLVFDNVTQLKAASNLQSGVSALCLGTNSFRNGNSKLFRIRTVTTSDTIDGLNLVALTNYPTLVAELVNETYPSVLTGKNVLLLGDSFLTGVGASHGWGYYLQQLVNPDHLYTYDASGGGFITTGSAQKTFEQRLDDAYNALSGTYIDYVILVGGRNDYQQTKTDAYLAALESFGAKLKQYFPNAKYYYFANSGRNGCWRTTAYYGYAWYGYTKAVEILAKYGVVGTTDLIWHTYHKDALCYANDNVHLSDAGYELYAKLINQFINGGDIVYRSELLELTPNPLKVSSSNAVFCKRVADQVTIQALYMQTNGALTGDDHLADIPNEISPSVNLYFPLFFGNNLIQGQINYTDQSGATPAFIRIPQGTSTGGATRIFFTYSLLV